MPQLSPFSNFCPFWVSQLLAVLLSTGEKCVINDDEMPCYLSRQRSGLGIQGECQESLTFGYQGR